MFGSSADILMSDTDDLGLEEVSLYSAPGSANACHSDISQSLQEVAMENLEDQIRELKDVNARLTRYNQEKDREIHKLRSQPSNTLMDITPKDSTTGKIVELAKAKRELTAKYEAEHSKVTKLIADKEYLEKQLIESQSGFQNGNSKQAGISDKKSMSVREPQQGCGIRVTEAVAEAGSPDAAGGDGSSDNSANSLHHRLQSAVEKATLVGHENQCLKQQLNKMQRLLERELGQNVDVNQQLRGDCPTFKGRDEQIQMLRSKVESIKREFEAYQLFIKESGDAQSVTSNRSKSDNEYNMKYKESLSTLEHKRREEAAELNQKYEKALRDFNDLRAKSAAEKARNDYLSKENVRLAQFNRHVLATCQKDAELIQYFQATIKDLRGTLSKTALLCASSEPPPPRSESSAFLDKPDQEAVKEENSLMEKITTMESQLQKLKNRKSFSFSSADNKTPRKYGCVGKSASSSSRTSLTSQRSSMTSGFKSFRSTENFKQLPDEKLEDSLSDPEESVSFTDADRPPECDLEAKIFADTLRICKTVSGKLQSRLEEEIVLTTSLGKTYVVAKENADLLQVQVDHMQMQALIPPLEFPSRKK